MSAKMVFCLHRIEGLDAEEFARYWRDEHAALFARYAKVLRVRRYTQSHRLPGRLNEALRAYRGAPDGYDGVAEVWFDSLEDLQAGLATPEAQAAADALIEDERRFIDHARSPIWVTEEIDVPLP